MTAETNEPLLSAATRRYMRRRGVKLSDDAVAERGHLLLECTECWQTWSPMLARGGSFRRGACSCPNGCGRRT